MSRRRAITRNIRRGGQVWIRVFPDKSVTMRAAETRMGSGKGVPSFWVAVIKPGHVIFELDGVKCHTFDWKIFDLFTHYIIHSKTLKIFLLFYKMSHPSLYVTFVVPFSLNF